MQSQIKRFQTWQMSQTHNQTVKKFWILQSSLFDFGRGNFGQDGAVSQNMRNRTFRMCFDQGDGSTCAGAPNDASTVIIILLLMTICWLSMKDFEDFVQIDVTIIIAGRGEHLHDGEGVCMCKRCCLVFGSFVASFPSL